MNLGYLHKELRRCNVARLHDELLDIKLPDANINGCSSSPASSSTLSSTISPKRMLARHPANAYPHLNELGHTGWTGMRATMSGGVTTAVNTPLLCAASVGLYIVIERVIPGNNQGGDPTQCSTFLVLRPQQLEAETIAPITPSACISRTSLPRRHHRGVRHAARHAFTI